MKKVITYGTYDLLHYGHIRLLERAKALGDYLIVAVTAEDFDLKRGKINVQQSLAERIEAVRQTGLADEIIVEEYEGQKIDDIKRYDIDIFTVGSDWKGKFDYLKEYCDVVYLDRTEGISSSDIRSEKRILHVGVIGDNALIPKFINEDVYVNGLQITAICSSSNKIINLAKKSNIKVFSSYEKMLKNVDAVYIGTVPDQHFELCKKALMQQKHVLCESPVALKTAECEELYKIADNNNVILSEAIKTAYSTAFNRLILLTKTGIIGKVKSIDSTCTSLAEIQSCTEEEFISKQNSFCDWGPTAMLPIFMILGVDYKHYDITTWYLDENKNFDLFTKVNLVYNDSAASFKVGKGVKSEGELIISGTNGYIYVPAPWWKTDYFEVRFEDEQKNKRYFYQLDGEGIRYELVNFIKSVEKNKNISYIDRKISLSICKLMERFNNNENVIKIR